MLRAVILAAGQGTRLRPYTNTVPKCLLKVGGRSILNGQMDAMRGKGICETVIVVGYQKEMIIDYAQKTFLDSRVRFVENPNFANSNNLYSLALAASTIPLGSSVLQLNGDVVFDAEVLDKLLHAGPAGCHIAIRSGKCAEEEIKVTLNEQGTVCQLNKRVRTINAIGEAVGINLYRGDFWRVLKRQLEKLKNSHPKEYFEYAVEQTIAAGGTAYPTDISNFRAIEIDFPEDLRHARAIFQHATDTSHG